MARRSSTLKPAFRRPSTVFVIGQREIRAKKVWDVRSKFRPMTFPVIGEPSGFFAVGTTAQSMVFGKLCAVVPMLSPCQPLLRPTSPSLVKSRGERASAAGASFQITKHGQAIAIRDLVPQHMAASFRGHESSDLEPGRYWSTPERRSECPSASPLPLPRVPPIAGHVPFHHERSRIASRIEFVGETVVAHE